MISLPIEHRRISSMKIIITLIIIHWRSETDLMNYFAHPGEILGSLAPAVL